MAGVGIKLKKIYGKNTIATKMYGFLYSTVVSIAPMLLVLFSLIVMGYLLGFSTVGFASRELFSCTVLYIFIFSLLAASPFNAVLSRYMADVIYNETFEDIMPCFIVGLAMNMSLGCLMAIPFCVLEYLIGGVSFIYVFTGFFGFVSLLFVFYGMLYLNIFKDYKKLSLYYLIGSLFTILLSLLLVKVWHRSITYSMLLSLVLGFMLTACLEYGTIKRYFTENSGKYSDVLEYCRKYWQLILTNFFYIAGLFVHNFVFWGTGLQLRVAKVFICAPAYDMATCIAMFSNISATVIFITRVEMFFHERYRAYSEAVIGGRGADIKNTKDRMFRQLSAELMSLSRIQFIVSVIIFFLCIVILPQIGFSGLTMKIYPSLAAGYFILFTMYACIVFLYYFNDLTGSVLTGFSFLAGVLVFSIIGAGLPPFWYGLGVIVGSFIGWSVAYYRLRWIEKHMDEHIFCSGHLLPSGKGEMPSSKVFDRYAEAEKMSDLTKEGETL